MSNTQGDLIEFRLRKAREAYQLGLHSISEKYWNSAMSELYYSCFYLILALFAKYDIKAHTHTGAHTVFSANFIKTGKIDAKWGALIKRLFDKRQKGDYGDFIELSEEDVLLEIPNIEEFEKLIESILKQS